MNGGILLADVFSKSKRSDIMRNIRSTGNKSTELRLIEVFRDLGIKGWRRSYPVTGHPDFVFLKRKVAVFTDGCFWHGHDCFNSQRVQNSPYWSKKIAGNIARDRAINDRFYERGWTVIRIWECQLKKKNLDKLVDLLSTVVG